MSRKATRIAASLGLALILATGTAAAGELAYTCDDLQQRARFGGFGVPIYQGDAGWFFRNNDLTQSYMMSDRSALFLRRLDAALKGHGVQLVLMPLPAKAMLADDHATVAATTGNVIFDPAYSRQRFESRLAAMRALGLPVVDVFSETDKADIDYFFAQDLHWRPDLARASAIAAAATIAETFPGEFPGSKQFATRLKFDEPQPHISNSRLYLNELCNSSVPRETFSFYETVEADQSVDAFLGEDSSAPPVSVIGTSFTDETKVYNFSGYLREALAADVATYSIAGGDIDQSLFKWAHTGQAQSGTRALVWEIPYLERLESAATKLERTVVPAIAGSCLGTKTEIYATDYSLDDKGRFTLTLPPEVKVSGDDYYLVAELSNPTPRGFTLTYDYRDGKRDIFPVAREPRVGAIDHLYAELNPALTGELGSISIRAMQAGQNSGRVALCRYPTDMPQSADNGGTGGADFLTAGNEVTK